VTFIRICLSGRNVDQATAGGTLIAAYTASFSVDVYFIF